MIRILIFIQLFSFVFCNEKQNDSQEKLPVIDLREGLVLETDINLQKYFDEGGSKARKILSIAEINQIKLDAKEYINKPVDNNDIAIFETTHGILKFK